VGTAKLIWLWSFDGGEKHKIEKRREKKSKRCLCFFFLAGAIGNEKGKL
jgi:hypothetical protein